METNKILAMLLVALGLMVCTAKVSEAEPMGTAWTYQGRLMDGDTPADGLYDFQFKLFDDPNVIDGNQVGITIDINDLDVIDGQFALELDFGSDVFNGDARWLETRVAQSDGNDPCTFRPRIEITPVPYALQTRGIFVDNLLNVGIGTTSPVGKLHVDGGKAMDGTWGTDVVIKAQDGGDGWEMQNNGAAGGDIILLPGEGGEESGVGFPGPDGNVGIGTTTPGGLLHLASLDGIDLKIEADTDNSGEDQNARVIMSQDGGLVSTRVGYREGLNKLEIMQEYNDSLILGTNNTDRLTITDDGKVGIGTDSPYALLDVISSSPRSSLFVQNTSTYVNAWFTVNNSAGGSAIFASSNSNTNPTVFITNTAGDEALRVNGALKVNGSAEVTVLEVMGADLAEKFPVSEEVKPGMVVAIDPEHPGKLCLARGAYNRCVAGVVSGANGLTAGAVLGNLPGREDAMPIALSGRVWVYCDATDHPVKAGDLLTTSERIGHAMAVTDYQRAQGAVIGKAMTSLENEKSGLVLALVNLQ